MSPRKSEGCFVVRNNGRLEYRFFYIDEYGQKKRKSISGGSREECYRRADEWLQKYMESIKPLDQSSTITDILQRKYEGDYEANHIGESTLRSKRELLRIIGKNVIGAIPISMVGINEIDEFGVSVKHYSNSVIEALHQCLKTAFAIAEEEALITNNPMKSKRVRKPISDRRDKKVRALTRNEQSRLIDTMNTTEPPYGRNDFRLQLFIELYSGMRMGEINALRLDSIDFENNVVHVNATVSRGIGANWFIKDGTKTEAGVRDVPISDKLKPYLEEALKKYKKNKQKLLFYDCVSKRVITTTQVNSYYKRVCSSVGIESSGQHALRHTFATRCIEAGIPAVVLKTWLGHKDIHMTLDTYTDVFQAMDNDAISKYDEHLNSM